MLEAVKDIWFSGGDLDLLAKTLCASLAEEAFEYACAEMESLSLDTYILRNICSFVQSVR